MDSENNELFDKDRISYVTALVDSKEDLLKEIPDFKEKDKMLSLQFEELENRLSAEDKEKLDKAIKLMYQVEEYYITLAYSLGTKYGKGLEKM